MAAYLISEPYIAGLNNFRIYLERYPGFIESFLKNLGLPSLDSGTQQTLVNIVTRARRDIPLWPDMSEQLRKCHQDVSVLINDTYELVTQLKLYQRPEGTDSIREHIDTLSLHAPPFNMNGKLGISPTSKTSEVAYRLCNALISFDYVLADAIWKMALIQNSTADIIPRTIDFMTVKIAEHEARHRRPDSTFSAPVQKQLESAKTSLESSKTEYAHALQAANNLHAYCTRLRAIHQDAKTQLLGVSDRSNVRSFLLQMNLMGSRINEAQVMVNQARARL